MVELAWLLIALVLGAGLSVAVLRLIRAQGILKTRRAACDSCGRSGPVLSVTYWQNTGMLVMRRTESRSGMLCRPCSTSMCIRMTSHTAVLGWWGTISLFITPLILINNLAHGLATWGLPMGGEMSREILEKQREYALNLLATKDESTASDVLVRVTGASEQEVREYLASLKPPS